MSDTTHDIAGRSLAEWQDFARKDYCLVCMVPSDLRQILGTLTALQAEHDAWKARAEAAEAALTREPYIVKIGPYHGICIGGRWDNWMFHMSANGQWVSQQKLSTASLTPPAEAAEAASRVKVGDFLPICECGMSGPCMWDKCKYPLITPPADLGKELADE